MMIVNATPNPVHLNKDDETIFAYTLPNGETCVTPDFGLALKRSEGVTPITLIYHKPHNDE